MIQDGAPVGIAAPSVTSKTPPTQSLPPETVPMFRSLGLMGHALPPKEMLAWIVVLHAEKHELRIKPAMGRET
jgi:hypothetical protein